jgi:predicted transcriptional regulator
MSTVRDEARKLIDRLPDEATWDDVMYELYVKKKLAAALKAVEEGRVVAHDAVRAKLLAE